MRDTEREYEKGVKNEIKRSPRSGRFFYGARTFLSAFGVACRCARKADRNVGAPQNTGPRTFLSARG